MKTEKRTDFREELAAMFIKALEEDPIPFIRGWDFSSTGKPINEATGKPYKGINKLYLKIIEKSLGYGDNRWLTFRQIKEKGYHLEKGAKGAKVEYYIPYDREEKKWITWEEYEDKKYDIAADGKERYALRQKLYTVFNASKVQGLPKLERNYMLHDIPEDDVIEKIAKGMGVPIEEVQNSTAAYYNPEEDYIHLPERRQFKTEEDYLATALHELGHATGHPLRLNRDQTHGFGTEEYAYEELIAEVTSSFMGEYVKEPLTDAVLDRHKAYIQNWVDGIKENKNFLFKAIKEADKAADYMADIGCLEDVKHESKEEISPLQKPKEEEISF